MYNLKRLRIKKNPLYTQMNLGKIIRYEDIGIVINKDGSLMATIEYRGPDLDSSVEEILAILTSQLNSLFMTLDTGFIFYFEMQRTPSLDYPTKNYFPDEVTKKIDLERRYQFKNLHKNFESRYFLTVYYMPPTDSEQKIKSFVLETKTKLKDLNNYLSIFKANIDKIYRMFIQLKLPLVKMLTPDELATYLHSCVSTNKMNIHLPDRENQKIKDNNIALVKNPIHLDNLLYDCSLNASLKPMLGEQHLRVITPLSFPSETHFGFFDELTYLNFSYRFVTRFYFLSKSDALSELSSRSRDWRGNLKSYWTYVREAFHVERADDDFDANAVEKVNEVENARISIEKGEINYGFYTTMIIITDKNVSVIFATQSLVDVTNSNIFHTVLDACQSKIFLANPTAIEEANKKLYKSFGLNDRQIQIIAQAIATRDYYYTSVKGSRLYDLSLGKFALAYVGINKADQNKCDEILKNYPREEFNDEWQKYKGVDNYDFT